jgi:predicted Zn-dependent protease
MVLGLGSSCSTKPKVTETLIKTNTPVVVAAPIAPVRAADKGLGDEIRSLTEEGSPSSLMQALDLIRTKELGASEFGRVMNGVILSLLQNLYPDIPAQAPSLHQSQTHIYSRILRNAGERVYIAPRQNSQDYLELVLPFLAFGPDLSLYPAERFLEVQQDLRRAEELNPRSVLAPYFSGRIYERLSRPNRAISAYERAFELSPGCYPAVLGQARVMNSTEQKKEALELLKGVLIQFPDNRLIKEALARAYYDNQDWAQAESAIAELLQQDEQNPEFILLYAHTLVEQGSFFKALLPLERYGIVNKNARLYLFLRARIQAEGYHNRDAALNYLRAILKASPGDEEVSVYTAKLLLGSSRQEEQAEGRELLQGLLQAQKPSLRAVDLAFRDAVRREAWEEAQGYMAPLLEEQRSQYLLDASRVEQGLGNSREAFSYAKEFHEQDPADEAGTLIYVSVLIDTGQKEEARSILESRLAQSEGAVKAEYYYLRSRLQGTLEDALQDLRSSLFEDPRNLHALMAMVEFYHSRNDQRRLVYYLKQALSFAPDNSRLRQYEEEYLL